MKLIYFNLRFYVLTQNLLFRKLPGASKKNRYLRKLSEDSNKRRKKRSLGFVEEIFEDSSYDEPMIEIMQPAEEEVFYEELYPAHFDEATYEGVLDFK